MIAHRTRPGVSPTVLFAVLLSAGIQLRAAGALAQFVDVTSGALGDTGSTSGVAWGDFDGDGDPDLYICNEGESNRLLRNDGGVFIDVTAGPLGGAAPTQSAAWGDYDNDGDLDLYVCNDASPNQLLRNDNGTFLDVTSGPLASAGAGKAVTWVDYDRDGDVDLYVVVQGGSNELLRNDAGTFTVVAAGAAADIGAGQAAAWADYDGDGDPDLYLTNISAPNKLIRNDVGVFVDATAGPLGSTADGLGVAWGDYDNDGDLDLYLSNSGQANKLFRNDGGVFVDATSGPLGDTGVGTGVAWGDYDNDGDLDLYLANAGQANKLFRNDGGTFVDATSGPLGDTGVSTGVAWADYDGDGDLDLYIGNQGTANRLLRNENANGNHWLHITPVGVASGRDGIGAVVRLVAGGIARTAEVSGGSGFGSQNSLALEFGLGATAIIDSLIIRWPVGIVQNVAPVPPVDTLVTVVESGRGFADKSNATTGPSMAAASLTRADIDGDGDLDLYLANDNQPNMLLRNDGGVFVAATAPPLDNGGKARSVAWGDYDGDGDLDVYLSLYLNASRLLRNDGASFVDATPAPLNDSGAGTGAAWADYDKDWDLDLYIAKDGAPNRLFRNDGGSFVDVTSAPLADAGSGWAVAWADYDLDGDPDLYLTNLGQPNKLFRNDDGTFIDATTGPLADANDGTAAAWGDYDGDGDPDLYVVNSNAANLLLRNDGGVFVDVTVGPLGDVGTGRAAAWGDYDSDGDLDLYVSNDGSNKLLINEAGVFVEAFAPLATNSGNGVGAAWIDFDLDGRLDLYLANAGSPNRLLRNVSTQVDRWLRVALEGDVSHRMGVGARVRVVAGGTTQTRETMGGSTSPSQNGPSVEFGLPAGVIDSLIVYWPTGVVQSVPPPAVDTTVSITEVFSTNPVLAGVIDVPDDQGGAVRLVIDSPDLDLPVAAGVTGYNVWQRVSGQPQPGVASHVSETVPDAWAPRLLNGRTVVHSTVPPGEDRRAVPATSLPPGTWELLGSFFATQQPEYVYRATTVADSPSVSVYVISAHTGSPSVWYVGNPDSGSSVDNIAPGVPQGFQATGVSSTVELQWNPAPEGDFQFHRVYRGTSPSFVIEPATLVHTTATTSWTDTDPGNGTIYYKLTTVDHQGNESEHATASVMVTVGVQADGPIEFALGRSVPNPFRGTTTIHFDVPVAAMVDMRVYDIGGRYVRTLVARRLNPGRHTVMWPGSDDAGRRVAAGAYLVRMNAGAFASTRRVTLIR